MTENIDKKTEAEKTPQAKITIRPVQERDLEQIQIIFEQWVRDENGELVPNEINYYVARIKKYIASGDNNFFVAVDETGRVTGMMGYNIELDEMMKGFSTTDKPVELINAFVSMESRGKGIGRQLISDVEKAAKEKGFSELVLNSGPRYEQSGWGFYDSLGFERLGQATDYYGQDRSAMVWHKILEDE